MRRVCLLHLDPKGGRSITDELRAAGFQVQHYLKFETAILRACRENPPDAFVIDLSRLPSHGREVAIALRQSPKTRHVPIVFCGGVAEKVRLIREVLPDAAYCENAGLIDAVTAARSAAVPAKPLAMMNRYGARTTAEKLGIKPRMTVMLMDPPRHAERLIGEADFVEEDGDVTLCFTHSVDDLRAGLTQLRTLAHRSKCWVLWRKKAAVGHNGVTEPLVRETGIALGLVDYKICSVDATWSAMLFARKKGSG